MVLKAFPSSWTLSTQTPTHHSGTLLLYLHACIPEAMFCFCFQSPSLKLQALEADLGPLPPPGEPQSQENLPAQQQPLSAEKQSLFLTHRLPLASPPSPPAQEQQTVNSSQLGMRMAMNLICRNDNIQVSEPLVLNMYLEGKGNVCRSCKSTPPMTYFEYSGNSVI